MPEKPSDPPHYTHTPERPHVQLVAVQAMVHEKLWALEVARGDAYVVFMFRVVEFGETPIDESELLIIMIDHKYLNPYT